MAPKRNAIRKKEKAGASQPTQVDLSDWSTIEFRDEDQRKRFEFLSTKKFEPTRWVDMDTLEKLGEAEEFKNHTGRIGIPEAFWSLHHDAYDRLTIEFLSSISAKKKPSREVYIKFRMFNEEKTVPLEDINKCFGFPNNNEYIDKDFDADLYQKITRENILGQTGVHTRMIEHPTLRFIHRALAQTIFARGESAKHVNANEMSLLNDILQPEPVQRNIGAAMIVHWKEQGTPSKKGGQVTMGGMITALAQFINIDVDAMGLKKSQGPSKLDDVQYRSYNYISWKSIVPGKVNATKEYSWILYDKRQVPMPIAQRIVPGNLSTYLLQDDVPPPPPPPPQQQREEHGAGPETMQHDPTMQHPPHSYTASPSTALAYNPNEIINLLHKIYSQNEENTLRLQRLELKVDDLQTTQARHGRILQDINDYNRHGYIPGESQSGSKRPRGPTDESP